MFHIFTSALHFPQALSVHTFMAYLSEFAEGQYTSSSWGLIVLSPLHYTAICPSISLHSLLLKLFKCVFTWDCWSGEHTWVCQGLSSEEFSCVVKGISGHPSTSAYERRLRREYLFLSGASLNTRKECKKKLCKPCWHAIHKVHNFTSDAESTNVNWPSSKGVCTNLQTNSVWKHLRLCCTHRCIAKASTHKFVSCRAVFVHIGLRECVCACVWVRVPSTCMLLLKHCWFFRSAPSGELLWGTSSTQKKWFFSMLSPKYHTKEAVLQDHCHPASLWPLNPGE